MLAALRSESVREPKEVFLVDRVQDSDSRPLDDLVLKGGNREWALPTVRFGYVDAPGRQRLGHAFPVLSPARALLYRIPLGLCPSLLRLLCWSPSFVRRSLSYYGSV